MQRTCLLNHSSLYWGWAVQGFSTRDQFLMTHIKLHLNLRDINLTEIFNISEATALNIFNICVAALYELLFEGVVETVGIPF